MSDEIPVFCYDPKPAKPLVEEGVTVGHQVIWTGRPGPAQIRPVAVLVDAGGNVILEPTGEWRDTNVVDDLETTP